MQNERWQQWCAELKQRAPFRYRSDRKPDCDLPYGFRWSDKEYHALEAYDGWLRGKTIEVCREFGYDECEECSDGEMTLEEMTCSGVEQRDFYSVCEACKLNNILGQIFLKDNWTENFSQYNRLDVDTRFPAETQLAGFKKNGFEMPPRAAEVLQLMVKAQRRRLNLRRKIDSLDDNGRPSGRYVHYPKTFDEAMSQFQDRRDTAHTDRQVPVAGALIARLASTTSTTSTSKRRMTTTRTKTTHAQTALSNPQGPVRKHRPRPKPHKQRARKTSVHRRFLTSLPLHPLAFANL